MNTTIPLRRRGPRAAARRERILAEFKRSGLSAYAYARQHEVPYSTLIQWLKRHAKAGVPVAFTEVHLPVPSLEPLVLELGSQARVRLSSMQQIPLAVELLKRLQA